MSVERDLAALPGLRRDEPIAPHTTYRIGGPAERYVEAPSAARLTATVALCARHAIPLLLLGNGSNLLVSDAGVEGLVVRPTDRAVRVDGNLLGAGAGVRMVRLAQAAAAAGLTGMEWALGIPGTVGGSVHNNAGCFGSDIAATLVEAAGVTPRGDAAAWSGRECAFGYRSSAFRDGALAGAVVTAATFALAPADPAQIEARMRAIGRERARTQPVSGRSTGSVFKNPPGDHAGRLVDAAGLKGRRVGGAMVSPEHANFIVNAGGASAADVATLVRLVQRTVLAESGVALECEIEAVGRWADGDPLAWPAGDAVGAA